MERIAGADAVSVSVVIRIAQDCIDWRLIRERMLHDAAFAICHMPDEVYFRRPREKSSDTCRFGLVDVTALLGSCNKHSCDLSVIQCREMTAIHTQSTRQSAVIFDSHERIAGSEDNDMRSIMARSLRWLLGFTTETPVLANSPPPIASDSGMAGLSLFLPSVLGGLAGACQSQGVLEPQNPLQLQAPPLGHPNGWRRSPR